MTPRLPESLQCGEVTSVASGFRAHIHCVALGGLTYLLCAPFINWEYDYYILHRAI